MKKCLLIASVGCPNHSGRRQPVEDAVCHHQRVDSAIDRRSTRTWIGDKVRGAAPFRSARRADMTNRLADGVGVTELSRMDLSDRWDC